MTTNKKIPMRLCIGCGEMKSKKELIRILKTEEEGFILDFTGKKNGRGAYICYDVKCLKKARKSKRIDKSLETEIPEEIYDKMESELEDYERA